MAKVRRNKFDILDVIVAFTIGFMCGSLLFCFSSPSSEARFRNLESGFFDRLIEPALVRLSVGQVHSSPEITPAPIFTVTAYCQNSCCCGIYSDGITASGHIIQEGDRFVAAPPWIPFGTRLSIPGYAGGRMVAVEDRGGAIQGTRLDVFFDSHDEALAWGVQKFEVER